MKKQQCFTWISLLLFLFFYSCTDNYHWDDINKDGVISYDKGLYLPLGSLDTIYFQTFELNTPAEVNFIKTVEGLFSSEFYKNFVIPINGIEEPLGDLSFSGDFVTGIANAASKEFSDITVTTVILKKNGENTGITIQNHQYRPSGAAQPYNLLIKKGDVLKLKDAYALKIVFNFSSKSVEKNDYLLISNLKVKSSGGIRVNWE